MAERLRFRLVHAAARANALQAVRAAPDGWHVEVRPPTRSLDQSARMHAMVDDIAAQVPWHGETRDKDVWKQLFLDQLIGYEIIPGLDGNFVPIRHSTADLTVAEMGDLMILMEMFGANHGVVFGEPARAPR